MEKKCTVITNYFHCQFLDAPFWIFRIIENRKQEFEYRSGIYCIFRVLLDHYDRFHGNTLDKQSSFLFHICIMVALWCRSTHVLQQQKHFLQYFGRVFEKHYFLGIGDLHPLFSIQLNLLGVIFFIYNIVYYK